MPYKSRRSFRKKKKTMRRRSRRTTFRPQRLIRSGFPKTTLVRMKYVDNTELNPTVGAIASFTYRANSIYDPQTTIGGHQPLGYDQWSAFYNHYVVIGSKIRATFASKTSSPATDGFNIIGINLQDDITYTADLFHMMEQGLTKYNKQSVHTNAQKVRSVTKGYSAKKFFNISNVLSGAGRYGASIGSNPTEEAFFVVFVGNVNSVIDPEPVTVLVEIEYLVVWREPKELPTST